MLYKAYALTNVTASDTQSFLKKTKTPAHSSNSESLYVGTTGPTFGTHFDRLNSGSLNGLYQVTAFEQTEPTRRLEPGY